MMNLKNLLKLFKDNGCSKIYVKRLSPNDNSKNQVYLGGNFEILNVLPISKIVAEEAGSWKKERFKATLRFYWLDEDGQYFPAPNSKLILYPKYPEVRFSGFLTGCLKPPSELMTQRLEGRFLFLGVTSNGSIVGYVAAPSSEVGQEMDKEYNLLTGWGVFKIISLGADGNDKDTLLNELRRVNSLGWIPSCRLDKMGMLLPCNSSNCGGYTLEAQLGITPNGYSEPDFLGWEIKQFGVKSFDRLNGAVITLMTPEPTGGLYVDNGIERFIMQYGYSDLKGRPDRINFGGIYKCNVRNNRTKLRLSLVGFDTIENKIRNANGMIALVDDDDNIAASWDFSSLLLHWNRKHNLACYVPSISVTLPQRSYWYGNKVILGMGTDFNLFLRQMSFGNIYYDPGIKLEEHNAKAVIKRRSQFRTKSAFLPEIYIKSFIEKL